MDLDLRRWSLLCLLVTVLLLSPVDAQVSKGGATQQGGATSGSIRPPDPPPPTRYEGTLFELDPAHNLRSQCALRYFIRLPTGLDILLLTKPDHLSAEDHELARFHSQAAIVDGYYVPERPPGADLQMMQSPLIPSDPRNPCGLAVINVVKVGH